MRLKQKWNRSDIHFLHHGDQIKLWKWDEHTLMIYVDSIHLQHSVINIVEDRYDIDVVEFFPVIQHLHLRTCQSDAIEETPKNIHLTSSSLALGLMLDLNKYHLL
jgi:hypothetical protein